MNKNYYDTLGIAKDASQEDIKKAFRKLSLQHHPDRNQGNKESEEKFKEINEAYSTLSDPQKRAQYDNPMFNTGFGGKGFPGFNDIFNFEFGAHPNRLDPNRPMRGRDLKYSINVSLSKFIFGGHEEFNVSYSDVCLTCGGTGAKETKVCSSCGGAGVIIEQTRINGMHMMNQRGCSACRGQGRIAIENCTVCEGKGEVQLDRVIEVEVPKDIKDGYIIRKISEGGKGVNGGPNGDLFIRLMMKMPQSFDFSEKQKGTITDLFG